MIIYSERRLQCVLQHCTNDRKFKKCLSWLLTVLLISLPTYIYTQKDNMRFIRISKEQGLPQVTINCILQDRKGFMWFGTQEGLVRYDGYDFVCYKHDPADPKTITDSYIWCILEDKSGILWIGTNDGGLNSFDPISEQFNSYQCKNDSKSLSHNYVRCIFEDHKGFLWIGTFGGGLNKFDIKNNSFTRFQKQPNGLSSNITCIYEDQFGILWIGTNDSGLFQYDPKADSFLSFKYNSKYPNSLGNDNVSCILEDQAGLLWVGTQGGGLFKWDRNKKLFENYSTSNNKLSNNYILCLYEDRYGKIWIGTDGGGINILDRKDKTFISCKNTPCSNYSLSNNVVMSIFEDRSGLMWIGTYSNGLNKYNPMSNKFLLYQNNTSKGDNLISNDIRAIYEDKTGSLWIGTYGGGINKFNPNNNEYINYSTATSNLSHDDVRCIIEDNDGKLWIGTRGGGLNKMIDPKKKIFKPFMRNKDNNNCLSNNYIRTILKDKMGYLWVGTEGGGINRFDTKKEKFECYTVKKNNLSNDIIFSIYEDNFGILWVGTRVGGLNKLEPGKKKFESFSKTEGLSHNFVLSICEDKSGTLWIGTYGGGLNKMIDRKKGNFKSYSEIDGLPNNVVYGILEDEVGNLWLSTNKGISKFDPRIEIFKNFDVDDGLQNDEFNAGAYFKSKETGEMFFGGINGLNIFLPNRIADDFNFPTVVFTNFLIAYESMRPKWKNKNSPLIQSITYTREITLDYNQNFFSFEFAALHYASPRKNRYQYKMEGWDKEWFKTEAKNRRATYTNLPPGDYVFKVNGSNKDGIWTEKETSIKISILPHPGKTWWAYTLYLLAFGVIVFLIMAASSRQILKRRVEKRTIELNKQKHFLEKINLIVSAINSEMEFASLLYTILREAKSVKGIEKASALVMNPDTKLFAFKASDGWKMKELENIIMTPDEVEERYINKSREIYKDIFIAKDVHDRPFAEKIQHLDIPKAILIMRMRCNGKYEAYFIFENMNDENAFDDEDDLLLLKNLKEHFVAAFQKTRLIYQLKSTQIQLIHSEKMRALGDLVANIAHEINNPVSNTIISIYNLRRDIEKFKTYLFELAEDEADKEILTAFDEKFSTLFNHLHSIADGTTRIGKIVSDLRTFSRKEKDETKPIKILTGLLSTINLVKTQYKDKVEFSTDFQDDFLVAGNAAELNQVFMNIVKNACQAIIEKQKVSHDNTNGNLTIKAFTQNDSAVISFQDNGIGMPENVRKKMFEPFYTTKSSDEGTGLGLSVSYEIIKKHHGHFEVESEEGKGTNITIILPKAKIITEKSNGR